MKRTVLTLSLLAGLAITACQKELDQAPPTGKEQQTASDLRSDLLPSHLPTEGALPGELYIRIRRSAKQSLRAFDADNASMQALPSRFSSTLRSLGSRSMEPLFPIDPRYEKRMRKAGLDLWYVVHFDEKQDLRAAMQSLMSVPEIDYTEPVLQLERPQGKPVGVDVPPASRHEALPFNDPQLANQWHYNNTGAGDHRVAGADIGLFKAWESQTGTPNVIVAIIDGGIDIEHPDLVDNLYVNEKEKNGTTGVDDDGNGVIDDIHGANFLSNYNGGQGHPKLYPDDVSHGTHVAGTVAARNGNGIGVCGIAGGNGSPNSGVRLMSCQIFGKERENGNSQRALVYAANNGAVIAQNSWGFRYGSGITEIPLSLKEAIDYFIKNAGCDNDGNQLSNSPMKGGVVIFAAGNDGQDYRSFPGAYPPVIAVSSMGPGWKAAPYTNRGDWVDIMAPGGDERYTNGGVLSTLSKKIMGTQEYGYMQGTSMACPHVSGVAALLVSQFAKQGFTNKECEIRLLGSLKNKDIDAENPNYRTRLGRGYIDASALFALNRGLAPNKVGEIKVENISFTTADLSWIGVEDPDDQKPLEYRFYMSKDPLTVANYETAFYAKINALGYAKGAKVSMPLSALKDNTKYYIGVVAVDRWDLKSQPTFGEFTTRKNNPPVLTLEAKGKLRVSSAQAPTFSVAYSDPDGQKVSINIAGETRGVSSTVKSDKIDFTLRAVAEPGNYEIKITAMDVLGAKTELIVPFEVYTYVAPTFNASTQAAQVVGISRSLPMEIPALLATHTEGIPLTYKVTSSNASVASASVSANGTLTIQGLKAGATRITVEVSDGISTPIQTEIPVRVVADVSDVLYSIYPIPAKTTLNLVVNPTAGQVSVEIYSLLGAKALDRKFSAGGDGTIRIPVKSLAPGTYTIKVKSSQGTTTKSFVKN
jgi:subtilase family domain protein